MTPPTVSPVALYTNSRQKPPGLVVPFTAFLILEMLGTIAAVLLVSAVLAVLR